MLTHTVSLTLMTKDFQNIKSEIFGLNLTFRKTM